MSQNINRRQFIKFLPSAVDEPTGLASRAATRAVNEVMSVNKTFSESISFW